MERLKLHFRELSGELITSKYLAGCLLGRFSAEIAGQSPRMLEHVSDAFARWSAGIARVVQEAAEAGELRQGLENLRSGGLPSEFLGGCCSSRKG